ncbi:unnamed protein product [Adineta ricciae]|uniref:Uncharacterized protein n=1 Tax=Adineta ricciae TaxID=249248 RepID=A0A815CJQ6_ADIRI|nr:unnamed protein product [Adineta ricciae]
MLLLLSILLIHYNINHNLSQSSNEKEFSWKLPFGSSLNGTRDDTAIKINVAGEIVWTTYSTLTYIPNTKLSDFGIWPRDRNYNTFLDFLPNLFKDFLSQLRR